MLLTARTIDVIKISEDPELTFQVSYDRIRVCLCGHANVGLYMVIFYLEAI